MANVDTEKDLTETTKKALLIAVRTATVNHLAREGDFRATVKNAGTGAPVAGLKLHFQTGHLRIALCDALTDPDGIAECHPLLDPTAFEDVLASGYDVIFNGNAEFSPVRGHGDVIPMPS